MNIGLKGKVQIFVDVIISQTIFSVLCTQPNMNFVIVIYMAVGLHKLGHILEDNVFLNQILVKKDNNKMLVIKLTNKTNFHEN